MIPSSTSENKPVKKSFSRLVIGLIAALLLTLGVLSGYIISDYTHRGIGPGKPVSMADLPPGSDKQLSINGRDTYVVAAVKKVGPAIVGITTRIYNQDLLNRNVLVGEGVGSGILFDEKGYIVTNNHVVAGAQNKKVTVSLSNGKSVPGTVIGADALSDLAVVKIDPQKDIPVAKFGDSATLQVGEPAIAIGNPLGLEFKGSVTTGVISALQRTIDDQEQRFPLIQTDAAINPGNSGGALVNAEGFVIGINSAKIAKTGVEGMGFAIPIDQAKPILKSLMEKGKVIRPYLGILAIDKSSAAKLNISFSGEGMLVFKIASDGPAAKSDLAPGDIITKIGDHKIESTVHLKEILDSYAPGETVAVTYVRNNAINTAQITVGTMPDATQ